MVSRFLPDVARFDSLTVGFFFVALACLVAGLAWLGVLVVAALVKGWRRVRWPVGLLVLGAVVGAVPLTWTGVRDQIDLGPLDRTVDGERHLTLTGWAHPATEYRPALRPRLDAVVLHMANPDVTDEVVAELAGMGRLRELDLNDTGITDASLAVIAALPALESLKLARTKVTDAGFRAHLIGKESLTRLNVQGTAVTPETVAAWREARPDRRALGP